MIGKCECCGEKNVEVRLLPQGGFKGSVDDILYVCYKCQPKNR